MRTKMLKTAAVLTVVFVSALTLTGCAQSAASSRSDSDASAIVNKDYPTVGGSIDYTQKIATGTPAEKTSLYNLYAIDQNSNVQHAVVQNGLSSAGTDYITYNVFLTNFPTSAKDQESLLVDLFHRMYATTYAPLNGGIPVDQDGKPIGGWCITLLPATKWTSKRINDESQDPQDSLALNTKIAADLSVVPTGSRICVAPPATQSVKSS
jgi:hypothetical protein